MRVFGLTLAGSDLLVREAHFSKLSQLLAVLFCRGLRRRLLFENGGEIAFAVPYGVCHDLAVGVYLSQVAVGKDPESIMFIRSKFLSSKKKN